jgi:hypothetical protein
MVIKSILYLADILDRLYTPSEFTSKLSFNPTSSASSTLVYAAKFIIISDLFFLISLSIL